MNTNIGYIEMIKSTLTNLYKFLYDVTPLENKEKIVKIHEFPDALLLFAIIKFNIDTMDIEINKMMATYQIDDEHKPKIIAYVMFLIDIATEIKKENNK